MQRLVAWRGLCWKSLSYRVFSPLEFYRHFSIISLFTVWLWRSVHVTPFQFPGPLYIALFYFLEVDWIFFILCCEISQWWPLVWVFFYPLYWLPSGLLNLENLPSSLGDFLELFCGCFLLLWIFHFVLFHFLDLLGFQDCLSAFPIFPLTHLSFHSILFNFNFCSFDRGFYLCCYIFNF